MVPGADSFRRGPGSRHSDRPTKSSPAEQGDRIREGKAGAVKSGPCPAGMLIPRSGRGRFFPLAPRKRGEGARRAGEGSSSGRHQSRVIARGDCDESRSTFPQASQDDPLLGMASVPRAFSGAADLAGSEAAPLPLVSMGFGVPQRQLSESSIIPFGLFPKSSCTLRLARLSTTAAWWMK